MKRKRALLYAALALAVPLPALALDRGAGAGSLDVQASLGGCGIADAEISCRIDVAFTRIPEAEYYTASVTAPDGSLVDLGTIASGGDGGASTSASVPFSGNGTYTVTVSAWGRDERGRPDVVESDRAGAAKPETDAEAGSVEAEDDPVAEPTAPAEEPPPAEVTPPPAEVTPPPAEVTPPPAEVEDPGCPEPVEQLGTDPAAPEPAPEEPAAQACEAPAAEPAPQPVP